MKIIIVNYRYFISGGPERYMFNVKELLERKGHTVIPFSVKSSHNRESAYEEYFLSPVGKGEEVYFSQYKKTDIKTIGKGLARMFYSFEARKKLDELIKKVQPDLIYVLHYQNKISASIFAAAARNNIPVVNRISDFGLICANGHFYRYDKNEVCEKCLAGSKMNAVLNKCVYNSYLYSAIKTASMQLQQLLGLTRQISAFVVPSAFTISKLQQFGIPGNKLNHIPTFYRFSRDDQALPRKYDQFALYVGRIEEEKGLMTLIQAFEQTDFQLVIIGFSSSGYDLKLKEYLSGKSNRIEFLGQLGFEKIKEYLSSCAFTVMPAKWYENLPNTVLESFAFKKPVVASDIGSLKELVTDNVNGLRFPAGNAVELRSKITYLFENQDKCIEMGEKAYAKLEQEYSEENHYQRLMELFARVSGKAFPA